ELSEMLGTQQKPGAPKRIPAPKVELPESYFTCESSIFCTSDFPTAPTRCSTTWPPLNSKSVGIPRMLYFIAVPPLESTSSLPTFAFPAYSAATTSIVGAICRHGPHHSAQKSTSTGMSDRSTSWSKPASVNVNVFCPISSPKLLESPRRQRIHPTPRSRRYSA